MTTFRKAFQRFLPFLALTLVFCSCEKNKQVSNVGTMVCIKSFENVMRQELIVYENVYKKAVVGCQYVSEGEALERLMSGDTRLAVLGRDLTDAEMARLKANNKTQNARSMQIAVDAIALIVNPENPVDSLTMKEIARILKGEVHSWAQIQPGAPDIPIKVVVDDPSSGVATFIRNKVLEGAPFDSTRVVTANSLPGVFERVKKNKGYIGLIGSSWLTSDPTKIDKDSLLAAVNNDLTVDGVALNRKMENSGVKTLGIMYNSLTPYKPTQENIYSGDYPLTRPIFMVTTASPAGTLGKFYSFVTGVDGQKIIMKTGVMPARLRVNVYEISN